MDIENLPDDTLFIDIYQDIKLSLIKKDSDAKFLEIYQNILKSLNKKLTIEKKNLEQQQVVIDESTKCCVCEGKIRMSMLQVLNGKIAHLCHDL